MRYLTNKEVAVVVGVSPSTITRIVNGQFGGKREQTLLRAKRIRIGGGWRWDAASLGEAIGKSEAEIEGILK